ncbi:Asp-tRNA(Asn)/Glu-tRNA(Gln) amidotransferase subunit GatC [Candidatus Nomurabacteria bacterium]|nr:Asp-tRNA(Asn)/Glu-tRNA(Gln) amidotransferase subunit GatC [Candidatus Kaiserbacteria bacterium]MCB9815383.1 Asp-tRNA(Asn)/Glu-tRNA(Gln) amidotransferase subunit GatC [Candidatus Nomurabacteria bacterium]
MKREDIEHLSLLARIELTEEEKVSLEGELSSIVSYVSVVSDIVSDDVDTAPAVGAVHNVFRKDEVTNKADQYTKDILAEMPATDGRFLQVKKILQTEE